MNLVSEFMGKKQHATLCQSFEERFPQLFGFESCGLLFIDAQDSSLYKITATQRVRDSIDEDNSENPENTGIVNAATASPSFLSRSHKPIIVRLPKDRGITGLAISTKAVQLVPNGEYHVQYAPEVDNVVGTRSMDNCLVGPCFDSQGVLRGVI